MKRLTNIFLLAAIVAVVLCSCSKAKSIQVNEDQVAFAINGGEKSIVVTADGSYEVTDCPDWLQAVTGDSTITLIAQENTTGAVRECVINLVGNEVSVPITVTQADKCTHITVSEAEVTIPKEGGSKELTIDTDGANLVMEASEGIPAELKDGKLTINAPANEGGTVNGTVTLTCDTVTTEVKVTLEGSICPKCNGTGKVKCPKCGGKGFTSSNTAHSGEDYGCRSCGGSGVRYSFDSGWANGTFDGSTSYENHGFRKGSGQMACPNCGGKGH